VINVLGWKLSVTSYYLYLYILRGYYSLFQKNLVHRIVYIGKLKEGIEDRMEVGSK